MKQLLRRTPPYRWAVKVRGLYRAHFGPGRLKRLVQSASPLRIVCGASGYVEGGWIGTEVEYLHLLDEEH